MCENWPLSYFSFAAPAGWWNTLKVKTNSIKAHSRGYIMNGCIHGKKHFRADTQKHIQDNIQNLTITSKTKHNKEPTYKLLNFDFIFFEDIFTVTKTWLIRIGVFSIVWGLSLLLFFCIFGSSVQIKFPF